MIVTADDCTFIEGGGTAEAVDGRLAQLRVELARAVHDRDVEILQERIARLSANLAVIQRRRADRGRPEGALPAHRGRAGGDAGGAVARASSRAAAPRCCGPRGALDALDAGGRLRARRGDRPRRAQRAAVLDRLQRRLRRPGHDRPGARDARRVTGLNALTGEFGDLFEKGVIDPVRVTRLSLEHAASVAALLLTTEALVAEELIAQPGAIIAPGFGDLAEGMARPSSPDLDPSPVRSACGARPQAGHRASRRPSRRARSRPSRSSRPTSFGIACSAEVNAFTYLDAEGALAAAQEPTPGPL